MDLHEKIAKLTTKESITWLEQAQWRKQNRSWLKKSATIALKVLGELRRQRLTQCDLATRTGITTEQVNKIVKGQENLTPDIIAKLEKALCIRL